MDVARGQQPWLWVGGGSPCVMGLHGEGRRMTPPPTLPGDPKQWPEGQEPCEGVQRGQSPPPLHGWRSLEMGLDEQREGIEHKC